MNRMQIVHLYGGTRHGEKPDDIPIGAHWCDFIHKNDITKLERYEIIEVHKRGKAIRIGISETEMNKMFA